MYDMVMFNADDGYLEAVIRGLKDGIISSSQYVNLTQCETLDGTLTIRNFLSLLEVIVFYLLLYLYQILSPRFRCPANRCLLDFKLQLSSTDYGQLLLNEAVLTTSLISSKCTDKLVQEFQYLRANAAQPLAKFLDYIT
jgi:V-type H+-transporting ATPase subunit d